MKNKEENKIIEIGNIVAEYYNISFEDLCYKTRKRKILIARQMSHTLCKLKTKSTLETIGELLGGKDTATVLHSVKTIGDLCETDKSINSDFKYLKFKVNMITYIEDFMIRADINKSRQLQCNRVASIRNKQVSRVTYLNFC